MAKKKTENLDKYPSEYELMFNYVKNDEVDTSNIKESAAINELRKAALEINKPEYTFITSTSNYTPTFCVNLPAE